nr:hypothetical protein [Tanacetum cinerariifolium]
MKHQLLALHSKTMSLKDAKAVATACYTQNHSIVRLYHGKTPYELLHGKLPDLSFLHVFGALCYLTNNNENLGKLQPKDDNGIFIGYAPTKKAFQISIRRTRRIIETIYVDFDELTAMASEQSSSGPVLHEMIPATISSGLMPKPTSSTPVDPLAPEVIAPIDEVVALEPAESTSSPSSITVDQDAPSPNSIHTIMHPGHQISQHNSKWTNDHPLENITGQLARLVFTRLQLHEQALFYYCDAFLMFVEPKTYKDALTQSCWIEAMQEELNEFERLKVWELVPRPDKVMVLTLKWIYKVKLDELGGILKNKARLVVRGYRQEEGIDFEESFFSGCKIRGYKDFSHVFRSQEHGRLPNGCEDCIFEWKSAGRNGNDLLMVQIYVDDIIFAASTPELCDIFAKIMCSKFQMSLMGKISFFLGLQISQSPRGIFINPSKYTLESLKKYGFKSCDPVDTPMVEKSKVDKDNEGKAIDSSHYCGMIGTILYLTVSRHDLQFAICMCTRYQARPTEKQLHAIRITLVIKIHAVAHLVVCNSWEIDLYAGRQKVMSNIPSQSISTSDITLSRSMSRMRTMDMTIDQQVALDEALVPHSSGLKIRKNVPEVYMQEFWATATVHHHSIHFKMNNKKRVVNPEYFREMLHICLRILNQPFDELPFEEEILAFLRNLGHIGEIKKITDFSAILPVELTNKDIRNSAAYKEYYAIASGAEPPKTKESIRKMQSSSDTTMPPPVAKGTRLQILEKVDKPAKGKQPAKLSTAKGLTVLFEVALTEDEHTKLATKRSLEPTHISQASRSDNDDDVQQSEHDEDIDDQIDDESHDDQEDDDDQDDEDDDQTDSDNDGDDFVHPKFSTHDEETKDKESFDLIVQTLSHVENSDDEGNDDTSHGIDSLFESTLWVDVPVTTTVEPLLLTAPTLPPPSIPIILQVQQAPAPSQATAPSTSLQDLPNFGSLFEFDHRLKTLEANFSKFMQINQFAEAISSVPDIVDRYIDHQMNEAVKKIKEQVKEQVKVQVSKILPKIEKIVNEQLKSEVLTRTSNTSKTSYVVAVDLSELELKKILIEKMESNKSDRGSKRRREGKDPESSSAPKEKTSKTSGKSTEGSKSHQKTASESAPVEEPMHINQDLEEPAHQEFEIGATDDQPIAEASQHPEWFQKQTKPPTPDRA